MKILIAGGGGFIGGHLAKTFLNKNFEVTCVDIKPIDKWYQVFKEANNNCADLKIYENADRFTKNQDYIFNLACSMGGMGFIENNKTECMMSVLINTNLLDCANKHKIKKYLFSSTACIYPVYKQKNFTSPHLKESDAYPADAEDGYGWEKIFSERLCRHFYEDLKLETRIARLHNVYGPFGTWQGGREKAPAALSRKFIEAKINNKKEIEIWGDGTQLRSFCYIDDCLKGMDYLFNSDFRNPLNIGSSEFVSINQLADILEEISGIHPKRKYILDAPKGVPARSSDNTLIKKLFNWEPSIKLKDGMQKTYSWIYDQFKK